MTETVESNSAGLRPRPQRILLADDEHLVAAGLRANLIELGYAVIGPATDGEEAIELARRERPDLAILDIRMPNGTGVQAGSVIARQFGIPVLMLSAYSDRASVEACNAFGVYGYLLKPVTQEQLRVAIEVAWARVLDVLDRDHEITRLKRRLEDRRVIEQAKWLLVSRKDIPEPEAMRLLQRQARNNRRTLVDVARSLIENESLLNNDSEGADPV